MELDVGKHGEAEHYWEEVERVGSEEVGEPEGATVGEGGFEGDAVEEGLNVA